MVMAGLNDTITVKSRVSCDAEPRVRYWHFFAVTGRIDARQLSGAKQTLSDRLGDGEF
jgi:hypothetical protein